jgi:hypothetical protein
LLAPLDQSSSGPARKTPIPPEANRLLLDTKQVGRDRARILTAAQEVEDGWQV